MTGEDDEAELELRKAVGAGFHWSMGALGLVLARRGRHDAARGLLAELDRLSSQRYVPRFPSALVHAGLGEIDRSFELFDQALEAREPAVVLSMVGGFSAGVLSEDWLVEARRRL